MIHTHCRPTHKRSVWVVEYDKRAFGKAAKYRHAKSTCKVVSLPNVGRLTVDVTCEMATGKMSVKIFNDFAFWKLADFGHKGADSKTTWHFESWPTLHVGLQFIWNSYFKVSVLRPYELACSCSWSYMIDQVPVLILANLSWTLFTLRYLLQKKVYSFNSYHMWLTCRNHYGNVLYSVLMMENNLYT